MIEQSIEENARVTYNRNIAMTHNSTTHTFYIPQTFDWKNDSHDCWPTPASFKSEPRLVLDSNANYSDIKPTIPEFYASNPSHLEFNGPFTFDPVY